MHTRGEPRLWACFPSMSRDSQSPALWEMHAYSMLIGSLTLLSIWTWHSMEDMFWYLMVLGLLSQSHINTEGRCSALWSWQNNCRMFIFQTFAFLYVATLRLLRLFRPPHNAVLMHWTGFRLSNHLIKVWKTCFSLKYLFWWPQNSCRRPQNICFLSPQT